MSNRSYIAAAIMAAITAANIWLVAGLFATPEDIFNDRPVATADFTFHEYYAYLGAASLRESGATWGYDPTFMAGSLFSPVFDPSNYFIELVAALFPFLSVFLAAKLIFVFGIGAIPLLIFAAGRNLGLSRVMAVAAGGFAWAYLWLGLPLEVTRYGMFLYVFGAAWGVSVFGWWSGLAERGRWFAGVGLVVSGALSIAIHIATLFVVAVPGALSFAIYARRFDCRRWVWTAIAAAVTVLCSMPWLGPYVCLSGLKTSSAVDLQSIGLSTVAGLVLRGHGSIEITLLVLSVFGFIAMAREYPLRRWLPLLAGAIALAMLFFSGHVSDAAAELQPRRFSIPLYFLLALPAARGAGMLLGKAASMSSLKKIVAAVAVIAALVAGFRTSVGNARRVGKIATGMPAGAGPLFDMLSNSTDRSGRIMIEDSGNVEFLALQGVKEGMSLLGLAPFYVGREFIGGPWPRTYIKPHAVDFQSGKVTMSIDAGRLNVSFADSVLMGRPLGSYDAAALERLFVIYNIKWVVCFSRPAIERFAGMSDLMSPAGRAGPFVFWRVDVPTGGYFLKGSGRISARPQEIRVEGAVAENGEVVLKYNWMPCMKVEPGGTLRPAPELGDPVGFMSVSGAPPDFSIVPDYGSRWFPRCGGM